MIENESSLLDQTISKSKILAKKLMETTPSEPFDYQEALDFLERAVDRRELDIHVIIKKLKFDEQATQELLEYMSKIPENEKNLPVLDVTFFLYHKLVSYSEHFDDKTPGILYEILVHMKTSLTRPVTTSKS